MEYKTMNTPMESNLKFLSDASLETVDATIYHQIIGSLMYMTNTRKYIFFIDNTLSQLLMDPRHVHLIATKNILRYLKGTVDYGLKYEENQKINLEGYVDLDWVCSSIDRKSTSRCCFSMGSGMISWFRRKQSYVALSTAEAEYVTTFLTSFEVVWLRKLLSDLFDLQLDATLFIVTNRVV